MHRINTNKNPTIMTVDDVSEYLRICRASVYRLVKRRKIPASRVGRFLRFRKDVVDKWLTQMENANHDYD